MPPVLHVEYRATVGWAHRLLSAIMANPALTSQHAQWRDSKLPDLAFAIETRFGAVGEAVRILSESLRTLSHELYDNPRVEVAIQKRGAFRFQDDRALRRALIATNTFILESRSIYENLAAFHRSFVKLYFGEKIEKEESLERLRQQARDPAWVDELRRLRHDITHGRSPWIEFEVVEDRPRRFDTFLVFDWRPDVKNRADVMPFTRMLAIRAGLRDVAAALRTHLIERVQAVGRKRQ